MKKKTLASELRAKARLNAQTLAALGLIRGYGSAFVDRTVVEPEGVTVGDIAALLDCDAIKPDAEGTKYRITDYGKLLLDENKIEVGRHAVARFSNRIAVGVITDVSKVSYGTRAGQVEYALLEFGSSHKVVVQSDEIVRTFDAAGELSEWLFPIYHIQSQLAAGVHVEERLFNVAADAATRTLFEAFNRLVAGNPMTKEEVRDAVSEYTDIFNKTWEAMHRQKWYQGIIWKSEEASLTL